MEEDRTISHAEYLRAGRVPALDGLRALSIASVVLFHAGAGGVVGRGIAGVSTFFTISGFLVTTLLLRERDRTGTISLRRFHVRRILRIWPLYFSVLALYVVVVLLLERGTDHGAAFFANLPYYATFTSNWFVGRSPGERVIFYFAWSLATQEQFYALWPSIIRFAPRRWAPLAFLVVLPFADLLVAIASATVPATAEAISARLQGAAWAPLCLGAAIAYVLRDPAGFGVLRRFAGQRWSAPAAALALLASLAFADAVVVYVAIAWLVASVAIRPPGVLGLAPLRRVGEISYGIYLLHMLALNVADRVTGGAGALLQFAVAFPLVVVVADLSYRYFESYFFRLRDKVAPRVPRPAAAVALPLAVAPNAAAASEPPPPSGA